VSSDAGDAEAGADPVVDLVGQIHCQLVGDDGVMGGGAEGPVGLGAVDPHPLPHPGRVDAGSDLVDHSGSVAVRDHPRVRHGGAEPASAFLRVTWVDAGVPEPDPYLTRPGLGIGQVPDLQHIGGGALLVVPDGARGRPLLK
jgi:hypothetical protein